MAALLLEHAGHSPLTHTCHADDSPAAGLPLDLTLAFSKHSTDLTAACTCYACHLIGMYNMMLELRKCPKAYSATVLTPCPLLQTIEPQTLWHVKAPIYDALIPCCRSCDKILAESSLHTLPHSLLEHSLCLGTGPNGPPITA